MRLKSPCPVNWQLLPKRQRRMCVVVVVCFLITSFHLRAVDTKHYSIFRHPSGWCGRPSTATGNVKSRLMKSFNDYKSWTRREGSSSSWKSKWAALCGWWREENGNVVILFFLIRKTRQKGEMYRRSVWHSLATALGKNIDGQTLPRCIKRGRRCGGVCAARRRVRDGIPIWMHMGGKKGGGRSRPLIG